nr:RNA-directed DNA polymerase, eukaryota, reverse transcriptase zinc-binding domain protein [Tanacetum cinerariifolium]
FTKKLSSWKANLLSIGGRLTLVKSVLGSLPIYFLSIFKAPEAVISKLESIKRCFFWGMKDDENKMVWICWQKILSCKKDDGLGVGSIKAKNLGSSRSKNVHGGTLLIVAWALTILIPHLIILWFKILVVSFVKITWNLQTIASYHVQNNDSLAEDLELVEGSVFF